MSSESNTHENTGTNKEKVRFDQIKYGDDYFHDPKTREETRKIMLDQSQQKIIQHIGYVFAILAPIITIINLNQYNFINKLILINAFIALIYFVFKIIFWSVYYDYSMTVAPKIPPTTEPYNQDSLLSRYKWAVDYRMTIPNSFRRHLAKLVFVGDIKFLMIFLVALLNSLYIALVLKIIVFSP